MRITDKNRDILSVHPNRDRILELFNEMRVQNGEEVARANKSVGLFELILNHYPETGTIVETGRSEGVSTEMFALLRPNCVIHSIDIKELKEATARLPKYSNVSMIMGSTFDIVIDGISALYLDSLHDYESVKLELSLWTERVIPGGIVSGHDYDYWHPGVIQAVSEHFGHQPPLYVYQDSSWIYYKE